MAGMQAVGFSALAVSRRSDKFAALSSDLIFDIFKLSPVSDIKRRAYVKALAQFDLILVQLIWLDVEP
jgi:hypothetical protein